ncbi:MAG: formylglycine-generating enzyme family protein [Pirellulales bacterium]|nr:formylglycine-generating enzyme family protein [Pirellulales bacterium]
MIRQRLFTGLVAFSIGWGGADNVKAVVVTDWVEVGDPGNPEHTAIMKDGTTGYGSVSYNYLIGEYEVTNDQYAEFLNAVAATDTHKLYHTNMGNFAFPFVGINRSGGSGSYTYSVRTGYGNKPVNYVTWFDAARYVNWLHNGQPTGLQSATTTEDGAYTFGVHVDESIHDYSYGVLTALNVEDVSSRNPGALYFLPNEHEWHKAAFYEPGADTEDGNGWWGYANQQDVLPISAQADSDGNISNPGPFTANWNKGANWNGSTGGNLTTVGTAGNQSHYGAKDMSGNVFEWVEADPTKPDPWAAGLYVVRGGAFPNGGTHMGSEERNNGPKIGDDDSDGADFLSWQRQFDGASPLYADFDGDFDVDGDDLSIWNTSYGIDDGADADLAGHVHNLPQKTVGFRIAGDPSLLNPLLGSVVPEPSSTLLALLAIGMHCCLCTRHYGRVTAR